MSIQNETQFNNTRRKLGELEVHRDELRKQQKQLGHNHSRELTLRSFNNLIKQLKEEIAVYLAHAGPASR